MNHELRPCTKGQCWIPSLLEKGYEALWPTVEHSEKPSGWHEWTFYVKWTGQRGTHVNKVWLCKKHHNQILSMFESEAAGDVREQEVTERWLIYTKNRMTAQPKPF